MSVTGWASMGKVELGTNRKVPPGQRPVRHRSQYRLFGWTMLLSSADGLPTSGHKHFGANNFQPSTAYGPAASDDQQQPAWHRLCIGAILP
jgi:hypothetical protein